MLYFKVSKQNHFYRPGIFNETFARVGCKDLSMLIPFYLKVLIGSNNM